MLFQFDEIDTNNKIDPQLSIDHWLGFVSEQPYKQIIESMPFVRLKNISFLGALDYTLSPKIKKNERNRATHSIHVAALANFIATKRNYSEELTRHLIIAALLHDIGHPPLSHSVEPYAKKTLGMGHHEISNNIINGIAPKSKSLHKLLNKIVDIDFILDLINQTSNNEGSDLFNNPINIDTIDGIIRSYAYIYGDKRFDCEESRLKIAQASFLNSPNKEQVLDSFWEKKHTVYHHLINSTEGLLADKASELFFQFNNEFIISENDLYKTEKLWKLQFELLFSTLDKVKSEGKIPSWLENQTIDYKARTYTIENSPIRYECTKKQCKHAFKSNHISPSKRYLQHPLLS